MKRHARSAFTLFVCTLVTGHASNSYAQSSIPDIEGYSVAMTQSEALALAKTKSKGDKINIISTKIATDIYSEDANIGFAMDRKDAPQILGDLTGYDRIRVYYDPNNSTGVLAIVRMEKYGMNSTMTLQSVEDGLLQKYGPPKVTSLESASHEYIWSVTGSFDKNSCMLSSAGFMSHNYINEQPATEQPSETWQTLSDNFNTFLNSMQYPFVLARLKQNANCGTVIVATVSINNGYVWQLEEKEINIGGAINSLAKYKMNFNTEYTKRRDAKMQKDSQQKPNL